MADEKVEPKPAPAAPDPVPSADKPAEKAKGKSIVAWIIIAAVVLVCAGAGIGLGLLFAGGKTEPAQIAQPANSATPAQPTPAGQQADVHTPAASDAWYFDLEPVVANLNEPGATRYVRAVLTLEISPELNADKGATMLTQKKPLLTNLLTIYLSGLSVEETRGDKNLKKIQSEICDTFNERLFPDDRPLIKGILIKEFAVQ